jgi:hypothetical protein
MKKVDFFIGGDPTPDDDPLIVEIRRRLTGLVEELAECNLI